MMPFKSQDKESQIKLKIGLLNDGAVIELLEDILTIFNKRSWFTFDNKYSTPVVQYFKRKYNEELKELHDKVS